MAEFYRKKKKVCMLCAGKTVSYKEPEILRKYINEKGKIVPRRVTGTCACHQRVIAREIKRARAIAYLPYTK
jgi:small subunit ribosomal protein S18